MKANIKLLFGLFFLSLPILTFSNSFLKEDPKIKIIEKQHKYTRVLQHLDSNKFDPRLPPDLQKHPETFSETPSPGTT